MKHAEKANGGALPKAQDFTAWGNAVARYKKTLAFRLCVEREWTKASAAADAVISEMTIPEELLRPDGSPMSRSDIDMLARIDKGHADRLEELQWERSIAIGDVLVGHGMGDFEDSYEKMNDEFRQALTELMECPAPNLDALAYKANAALKHAFIQSDCSGDVPEAEIEEYLERNDDMDAVSVVGIYRDIKRLAQMPSPRSGYSIEDIYRRNRPGGYAFVENEARSEGAA